MVLPFTLQQLRIFKAIASEKSFTNAAELLFVSQPSLSKQIKILENRLGILLLNRNNNNLIIKKEEALLLLFLLLCSWFLFFVYHRTVLRLLRGHCTGRLSLVLIIHVKT